MKKVSLIVPLSRTIFEQFTQDRPYLHHFDKNDKIKVTYVCFKNSNECF